MVEAEDIFSLKLTVTKVAEQHILNVGDILTITKNGLLGKEDKGNKVFFGKNKECQVPFDVEDNTLFADYQAMIYYSEEENLNGYVIKCLSTVAPLSPTKIKINPGDKHALNKDDWLLLGWHYGFVVTDIGPMKGMAAEEGSGVYNVGQSVVKATSLLKGSYMSGKESPFIHIKWVDGPEELIKAPNYSKYWPYPGCPVTPLVMGRAAQGINYPIRYPESEMFNELSRIHCKVDYDENIGWFITEDAPVSTNGTFFSMKQYSDAYLEGRQNVLIGDEWEIYMGNNGFKVSFDFGDAQTQFEIVNKFSVFIDYLQENISIYLFKQVRGVYTELGMDLSLFVTPTEISMLNDDTTNSALGLINQAPLSDQGKGSASIAPA